MKILKRILIALIAILLIVSVGIYFYVQSTAPVYSGEQKLAGLKESVEINYDNYGVPHIYAQNLEDAYFGLGYAHAQDRLFQMEMLRRAASGRLAEVLGKDLVKVDKLFRTLGINQFAKQQAAKYLSADTADFQKAALAYQKGINAYIHNGKTPLEFTIMGIPKTDFTPEDIYHAIGFMSFGFAEGIRMDPVMDKIRTELGEEYLKPIAVQTPKDAVRIPVFNGPVKTLAADSLIASIHDALETLPVPLWVGSNGWVVAGDRTASGKPILANDTHIGFGQPAVWYEANLEYPGFRFYGHHLAGVPFGMLGNNTFCGWGLTMFENDDTDFYRETLNPNNSDQVMFNGTYEAMSVRDEVIKVKGESDVVMKIKTTRHGPIVNGIIDNVAENNAPIALYWTLHHIDNEALQGAYQINHATNFEQARAGVIKFTCPGLNVMYGDVAGNIAWWAAAKLPIRPAHVAPKFFLDGSSGKDEYLGFYDFTKNPQSINPPSGFVYSANNQPDSVDHVLYPGYYYPRSRSGRIVELLGEDKKWTLDDMKKVNLDVKSRMLPDIAKEMAAALKTVPNNPHAELVTILEQWDGDHQINDIAPSVYYNMLVHAMSLAMKDELGESAYKSLMMTSILKNSYDMFFRAENSPWWDDVTTKDKKETRADIFDEAAKRTIASLHETSGPAVAAWTWGKIHTLTHKHPLDAVKPLAPYFNVGPLVVPGGSETVNNLHFELDTDGYFQVNGGPALRKIMDFSNVSLGETVSPTGQSGNVMSAYYDDEAEMYATGKFRRMLFDRKDVEASSGNKLVLKPN